MIINHLFISLEKSLPKNLKLCQIFNLHIGYLFLLYYLNFKIVNLNIYYPYLNLFLVGIINFVISNQVSPTNFDFIFKLINRISYHTIN